MKKFAITLAKDMAKAMHQIPIQQGRFRSRKAAIAAASNGDGIVKFKNGVWVFSHRVGTRIDIPMRGYGTFTRVDQSTESPRHVLP